MTCDNERHPLLLAFELSMALITGSSDLDNRSALEKLDVQKAAKDFFGVDVQNTSYELLLHRMTMQMCDHLLDKPHCNVPKILFSILRQETKSPVYQKLVQEFRDFQIGLEDRIDDLHQNPPVYEDDNDSASLAYEKDRRYLLKIFKTPILHDEEYYDDLIDRANQTQQRLQLHHSGSTIKTC